MTVLIAAGGGSPLVTITALTAFAIVVLIVKLKAWGLLMASLDERERKIREQLELADKATAAAAEAARENEQLIAEAKVAAKEVVAEGRRDAEVLAAKIEEDARAASEEISERARADIERAKLIAVHEIHQRAVALSVGISEELVRQTLSADDHQALVDQAIQNYEKMS
ncbi:MAG: F0F1 ATP synthase subunit B [Planctomycetota bacterium]